VLRGVSLSARHASLTRIFGAGIRRGTAARPFGSALQKTPLSTLDALALAGPAARSSAALPNPSCQTLGVAENFVDRRLLVGIPHLWQAAHLPFQSATEKEMSTSLEAIQAEVLRLSPSDRSRLLDRLIVSLDADVEVEAEWGVVADAREADITSGVATAVPLEEAMARLEARFKG
jgi:hypothetical protein